MRLLVGILIGKLVILILKITGRGSGTALPGLILEKLKLNIIPDAINKINNRIIITGTNGKTTTQTLLSHFLDSENAKVFVNSSGSNLRRGIASQIITSFSLFGGNEFDFGIFEIEEATFPKIVDALQPQVVIITNFFRDQLDAYGEISRTRNHVLNGLKNIKGLVKIVYNDDDPQIKILLSELRARTSPAKLSNYEFYPVKVTGLEQEIEYEGVEDINSDFEKNKINSRPVTLVDIVKINSKLQPILNIDQKEYVLTIPGKSSAFSAGFAMATLNAVEAKYSHQYISSKFETAKPAFGRGEIILANGINWQFFLVKNPVGFDLTLNLLREIDTKKYNIVILINDRIADGRDVSWLWDSKIEKLLELNIAQISLCGIRAKDMHLRLKYACIDNSLIKTYNSYKELKTNIENGIDEVTVIATYTAMNEFRNYLLALKETIPKARQNSK